MKQKLLPTAILAATALSTNALANDVTVYGKVNLSLNANDFEMINQDTGTAFNNQDNWTLNSNASRLGVKGSIGISENLKAIYKLEYELIVDEDEQGDGGSDFKQRNTHAGLQGNWGTLVAGRHDTPVKMAQGKVDRFNDLVLGDIKYVMVGETRADNIIMYSSPTWGGFGFTAAVMPGEDGADPDSPDADTNDGISDHISVAVNFKYDIVQASLAVDDDVDGNDIVRGVVDFSFGDFKVGGLVQQAKAAKSGGTLGGTKNIWGIYDDWDYDSDDGYDPAGYDKQDAYLLSGTWTIDKVILKAQYGYSESTPGANNVSPSKTKVTQTAIGADYKFNKQAKLFAYYSMIDSKGNTSVTGYTDSKVSDSTAAVGFEFKF